MLKEMPKNEGGGAVGKNQYGEYDTPTKTEGVNQEMPKNEGGWTQKQSKESCGTKTEPQETIPTYLELGIDYKDASRCQQMAENKKEMPKNEGAKTPNTSRGTKMELRRDVPPTYQELNIDKKDASRCQQMVFQ